MPIPGAVGRVHGTVMLVEALCFAVVAVVHLGHRIGFSGSSRFAACNSTPETLGLFLSIHLIGIEINS